MFCTQVREFNSLDSPSAVGKVADVEIVDEVADVEIVDELADEENVGEVADEEKEHADLDGTQEKSP